MSDEVNAKAPTNAAERPAVLVVEDDPVLAIVLRRLIETSFSAYDVVHVTNGAAALACLSLQPLPLAITDYHLASSMDGLKLAAAIRAQSPETRIVLITAYATSDIEQAAYAHGVEFYLPKPFLLKDLTTIVRTVLNWWQSEQPNEPE
jgi:two-component system response regulator (stage 0 sporulation protein F)